MTINFDQLPDRRSTESLKWHYFDSDVLPMWVADMDFRSPEPVIDALRQRVEHGVFGYPIPPDSFFELIIERMDRLHHWKITREDIALVPGIVTGFNMVCHAMAGPAGTQTGVLIQTPVYPPFLSAHKPAGLLDQQMELTRAEDGSYSINYQAFEAAITSATRLFILSNPHNPIGRVFRHDELQRMADICLRHNVVICADEIHSDLIYPGFHHIPMAALSPEVAQQTITFIAPSKTFNIAGLECSVAIIQNPDLRRRFEKARMGMVHGINALGLVAGEAAYRYGQPWLDELLVYLQSNRDYLFDFVQKNLPGVRMNLPESTYLAWLDCREANLPVAPCEFFLREARVGVNDGATFGKGGEGFVRLNFGCPRSMLQEALERMSAALKKR